MNLCQLLFQNTKSNAVVDGSDKYSHEQLASSALRLGNGLANTLEIKPGNRVAIIAHNSVEFLISYLGILSCGAVAIPLDPNSSDSERARDISHIRPHLILTSSKERIPSVYSEAIAYIEFSSKQWRSLIKSKPIIPVEREKSDAAVMMMTSGVSFQPRPAMLTHGSLIANLEQAKQIEELKLSSKDSVLAALPMYHIFGLHVIAGLSLACGSNLIVSRTFDPVELANLVDHENVTILPGVPALFDSFVREPSITIDLFSKVRLFVSGGAPMKSDLRTKFYERFGVYVAEGYGLTEASPIVSFTANAREEGDIGKPLEGVEIDVRDSSGATSVDGDVGQIVVKGENVFSGYFGDREATSKVLDSNGWLFTGDIGVRNENGLITLIDRSSDVIVVHGFSVYPSEIESVLLECDLVDQVSVVGELDDKSGEAVVAYVSIPEDVDALDDLKMRRGVEKELREFCLSRLARYKVPSRFEFVGDQNVRASTRPLRKSLRSALKNFN